MESRKPKKKTKLNSNAECLLLKENVSIPGFGKPLKNHRKSNIWSEVNKYLWILLLVLSFFQSLIVFFSKKKENYHGSNTMFLVGVLMSMVGFVFITFTLMALCYRSVVVHRNFTLCLRLVLHLQFCSKSKQKEKKNLIKCIPTYIFHTSISDKKKIKFLLRLFALVDSYFQNKIKNTPIRSINQKKKKNKFGKIK